MCSLHDDYETFRRGFWADPDAAKCLCRGCGYALSDLDTWHECRYHFVKGQHHPEDDCDCGQKICVHTAVEPTLPAPPPDFNDDDIPF